MIKCNIDFTLKNASIFIDDNFIETKSFDNLDYRKETSKDFKNCNDLYLINKISIYLKTKYNAKETETLFIIDNKDIYDLLKPNDILIKKLTKPMKKGISNNELKLILGSTLFEMNSIQNVDLILQDVKNKKGDEDMFDNKTKKDNFNLNSEDSDFDFEFESEDTGDFSDDFDFDLDSDIPASPFKPTNADKNKPSNLDFNLIDYKVIKEDKTKDVLENGGVNKPIYKKEDNFAKDSSVSDSYSSLEKTPIVDDKKDVSPKKDENSSNKKVKKNDNLKAELLKEFENMESYIDEQISSLEKKSKELEDENSKLKLNLNDLNIDEDVIIENFNKSMEIRLRLKVIKKSCKIYNNMKIQLKDELSKF